MEGFKIADKKILFICRKYFGYEEEILNQLKQNNQVFHLIDVPFNSILIKIIIRFFPYLFFKRVNLHYKRQLLNCGIKDFDYVFVIIGESVSSKFLNELKFQYPNAKLILYIWDSIKNNRKNLIPRFKLYDEVFCFQKEDASRYGIKFLPLFFIDSFKNKECDTHSQVFDYDICFIGTAHADRPKIIQKIIRNLGGRRKIFTFLYLHSKWLYFFYKVFYYHYWNVDIRLLNFDKLEKNYISYIYKNTRIIIDIQHPKQTGLTIRTFEVLASGSKLVTTNADIVNYDFYDENQIYVINRKNPVIADYFFENKTYFENSVLLENYTLTSWLNKIFLK